MPSFRNVFDYHDEDLYLEHHGIKGQKWGVTNGPPYPIDHASTKLNRTIDEHTILYGKTKKGANITLEQIKRTKFSDLMAKLSKKAVEEQMKTKIFDVKVGDSKVGDLQLYHEGPEEVNGVWLGIDVKQRGNGYASAALDAAITLAKQRGYKKFTLEVPGNAPDARHIYERAGFKVVKQLSSPDEDWYWGGLTAMELLLDQDERNLDIYAVLASFYNSLMWVYTK